MIDRRKFVALLSAVPLIGKSTLAACLKDKPLPPPGYVRCDVCGEFNGTTDAKFVTEQQQSAHRRSYGDVPPGQGSTFSPYIRQCWVPK